MTPYHRRLIAAFLGLLLAVPAGAAGRDASREAMIPGAKFSIGPIIGDVLAGVASGMLRTALPPGSTPQQNTSSVGGTTAAPPGANCYVAPTGDLRADMRAQLLGAGCQYLSQTFATAGQSVLAYVTPGTPPASEMPPLRYDASGTPNYQGIKVTVLMADETGRVLGERPVNRPFMSGELFRLKIQPSFDGLLEVEHVGPAGRRTPLFPKPGMGAVLVAAGKEISLPLGDAVYEFDAEKGNERFIFRLRDPAVTDTSQYPATMMSQDMGNATFLGQLVPAGKRPYIAHAIEIQHR